MHVKTYYPTEEDMKRNPHMKPCAEHEVVGIDNAVNKIMEIFLKKGKK